MDSLFSFAHRCFCAREIAALALADSFRRGRFSGRVPIGTTGCGGVSRYAELQPPPPYMRAYNDKVFSFTQVDLTATRFEMKQIDENGKVIDEYSITKPESQVANVQ